MYAEKLLAFEIVFLLSDLYFFAMTSAMSKKFLFYLVIYSQ